MMVARGLRSGAATMIVALPTFWSMQQLALWRKPPVNAIVFAVMLGIALPRALARARWADAPAIGVLLGPACAAAVGCGMLLSDGGASRAVGAVAFSAGAAIAVWLRRFGSAWRAAGTVASTLFLAVLVRLAPLPRTWSQLGWMLVAAGVALVWALALRCLTVAVRPAPSRRPAAGLPASTRMAVQLGCGTLASFAAAQWLDPDHLVWPVLTVMVVHSANRGRGDVLRKGAQRTVGALVGTGAGTVLGGLFQTGSRTALVALFAVLALAAAARPYGYLFWSAGVTAALVFLYSYFGESGADLLARRLLGIAVGGAIGMTAAWFVLPVRRRGRSIRLGGPGNRPPTLDT